MIIIFVFGVIAFCVAWAFTGWQNHLVLEIMNSPLPTDDAGNQVKPITLGPAEGFSTTRRDLVRDLLP